MTDNQQSSIYNLQSISPEASRRAYLNILEDMQADKATILDHRRATFNILEDITEAQTALQSRMLQVETMRNTLEKLALSVEPRNVMETVAESLSKLIPFYTLSYVISRVSDEQFGGNLYIKSKGPIGSVYVSSIMRDFITFVENLPRSVVNKGQLSEQLHKKTYPEFTSGFYDEENEFKPSSSAVVPLIIRSSSSSSSNIIGVFHISSVNPKEVLSEFQLEILRDIANVSAVNMGRIKSIAATEQARLASLLRSINSGVILFDTYKNVILSNPSAARMIGLPEQDPTQQQQQQQLSFKEIERIFDEKDLDFSKKAQITLEEGKEFNFDDFSLVKFTYQVILVPVRNLSGGIIGGALIFHDITHLKEIDKMKTEFVSVASHQLRTPLTAIKLFIEMLGDESIGKLTKKQAEYVSDVGSSTERMINLVNDLLNVSRLETGRLKIEPEPTMLDEFIESVIHDDRALCAPKKCSILYKKPTKEIGEIMIDKTLFRQVVHNLITNAIRYSKEKGEITVTLEDSKSDYKIAVKDNGIGIPKEAEGRIFEKFFRADNAQKAEAEGSGLGLYVVKMVVEAFGGKIWFESPDGKGTTFYVTIPHIGMKEKKGEKGLEA